MLRFVIIFAVIALLCLVLLAFLHYQDAPKGDRRIFRRKEKNISEANAQLEIKTRAFVDETCSEPSRHVNTAPNDYGSTNVGNYAHTTQTRYASPAQNHDEDDVDDFDIDIVSVDIDKL